MNKISTHDILLLIITSVISTVIGGSGITGIVFYFVRKRMEAKLDAKEKEEAKKKQQKMQRRKIDDELQHCEGRLFFWIHKAIVTGAHNGDLESAFEAYQQAETAKKDFDRELIVESEYE